ncbi:MAG: hypothetical protein EOP88_09975 [Verrucomicrobiaceae bacterium]|nr:MAG: hypothetical protein EOP88_09975 [Verrucomicrobiaceae bacterium]
MIVPQYWAEGRIQQRNEGKQVTVRRFGWSDVSQEEAQVHADQRTAEALQRILSGEKLERRETTGVYNGAQGVPIREEILDRREETILTRNSYGAACLNTPDVLFADIDFETDTRQSGMLLLVVLILLAWLAVGSWLAFPKAVVISSFFIGIVFSGVITSAMQRATQSLRGGAEKVARTRIARFAEKHPKWNLRVYRTPAGFRVLATHQRFRPEDPEVEECFEALGTDPVYRVMCRNQHCFRARVSPKPWRIGIGDHLRIRPGIWPVSPDRVPQRNSWIERYESAAGSFAACRFEESAGSGIVDSSILPVIEWHDELSRATSGLPIA